MTSESFAERSLRLLQESQQPTFQEMQRFINRLNEVSRKNMRDLLGPVDILELLGGEHTFNTREHVVITRDGTWMDAGECVIVDEADLPDGTNLDNMSDSEIAELGLEYGQPIPLPGPLPHTIQEEAPEEHEHEHELVARHMRAAIAAWDAQHLGELHEACMRVCAALEEQP